MKPNSITYLKPIPLFMTMNKKKVLVTATTFPRWKDDSEPNFVYLLCKLLVGRCDITVLVPHHPGAKRYEVMDGVNVYRFRYFFPLSLERLCYDGGVLENIKKSFLARIQVPFLLISEFLAMKQVIKKEKIDFIHAHWLVPQGYLAALIKKFYKIPYIATAHAGDVFPIKKFRSFARDAIAKSTYLTANSNFTKDSINKISKKRVDVIPMGVDINDFNPSNKDDRLWKHKTILFVGRLAEKKGAKYLIKAMPKILKKVPAKLVIVGDGPERKNLVGLTKELNLQDNVVFEGKIPPNELPKFYASADVFVGPSIVTAKGDTEGLGIVFIEAIASGTCVVGSKVGGIPDIIKHNETGLLVREKNPEGISRAVITILGNVKMQKRLCENALKHIQKNYSWKVVAEKFSELYGRM